MASTGAPSASSTFGVMDEQHRFRWFDDDAWHGPVIAYRGGLPHDPVNRPRPFDDDFAKIMEGICPEDGGRLVPDAEPTKGGLLWATCPVCHEGYRAWVQP